MALGRRLQAGLHEVMTERSVCRTRSAGHPIMFGIVFAEAAPTDYRGWVDTDHDLYDEVVGRRCLRGAMPEPDSREPWFLSESHAARRHHRSRRRRSSRSRSTPP